MIYFLRRKKNLCNDTTLLRQVHYKYKNFLSFQMAAFRNFRFIFHSSLRYWLFFVVSVLSN